MGQYPAESVGLGGEGVKQAGWEAAKLIGVEREPSVVSGDRTHSRRGPALREEANNLSRGGSCGVPKRWGSILWVWGWLWSGVVAGCLWC